MLLFLYCRQVEAIAQYFFRRSRFIQPSASSGAAEIDFLSAAAASGTMAGADIASISAISKPSLLHAVERASRFSIFKDEHALKSKP